MIQTKNRFNFILFFAITALGLLLGSQGDGKIASIVMLVTCVLVVIWVYLEYRGVSWTRFLFWVILVTCTYLVGYADNDHVKWDGNFYYDLQGQVKSITELSSYQRVIVRLEQPKTDVAVHLPLETQIESYDNLVFTGEVTEPPSADNPGVFCYKTFLARQNVYGMCWPESFTVKQNNKPLPLIQRLAAIIQRNIEQSVDNPGLLLALVLGNRDHLSDEQVNNWRVLGISHLLAISGMHISLLAAICTIIVMHLPLNNVLRLVIVQIVLLCYVLLSGANPSTLRAFLGSFIGGLATLRHRRQDPLHIWAVVGFLLLLLSPKLVTDPSFQLSFCAAGGIILWAPALKLRLKSKVVRWAIQSLIISVIAQGSLLPLLVHYFGELSLMGPIATLLFLPFIMVLLLLGILIAIGLGPYGLGTVVNFINTFVALLEGAMVKWAVLIAPPGRLLTFYLWWGFFLYTGWTLRQPQVTFPRQSYRKLAVVFFALVSLSALPPQIARPLEVTALNVGQGDCFYIHTPYNQHILIDGGGDSVYWQERGRNVGEEQVVPYLRARGVEKIDLVILSHPHEDHLHGLLAVLEGFPVDLILDNGKLHNSPSYERYLSLIMDKEINYNVVGEGDYFDLIGGVRLNFLHPHPETIDYLDHNDASLVLSLEYQRTRMLFTGDLDRLGQQDLLERTDALNADWLKVPHHGSRNAWTDEFYEAISPSWAVISVGQNTFGHPHTEVLQGLEDNNIRVRRTDQGPVSFYVLWGFLWTTSW